MTDASGPPPFGLQFGSVADTYDEVRPEYPDQVYDLIDEAIGGIAGRSVVDLAAGTGLQTRALARRGARLIAIDRDRSMLDRLVQTCDVPAVVGRGEQIPLRDGVADVVVCATAWHWLRIDDAVSEVRRVVRPGGHLALWWGLHAWGDNVEWEDIQSAIFDRWNHLTGSAPPPAGTPPREAVAALRVRGLDVIVDREITWSRTVSREQHLRMLSTHANHLIRSEPDRRALLAEIDAALAPWPELTERLWGPLIIARVGAA